PPHDRHFVPARRSSDLERAFCFYFFGIDIPPVAEGDYALFNTKQFKKWLEQQIAEGTIPKKAIWHYDPDELMQKFWETVREQMEDRKSTRLNSSHVKIS